MSTEEFLRDVCPNHTDKSKWNKSELLQILELHKEQLRNEVVSEQVCLHPDKYFVSGIFGGYWCPKCDRNVDDDFEQKLH